jgi:hypothetical protein
MTGAAPIFAELRERAGAFFGPPALFIVRYFL